MAAPASGVRTKDVVGLQPLIRSLRPGDNLENYRVRSGGPKCDRDVTNTAFLGSVVRPQWLPVWRAKIVVVNREDSCLAMLVALGAHKG